MSLRSLIRSYDSTKKGEGFIPHLNVHRFISKCMGERWRRIDEGHDAQTIVHKSHVGHNNTHDGLRSRHTNLWYFLSVLYNQRKAGKLFL